MYDPPKESRVGVAAYVGQLAHARLLGQPDPALPRRVNWDSVTPTAHVANVQADAIVAMATERLKVAGWRILDAEDKVGYGGVYGTLDMRAWSSELLESAIIDLKTGGQVSTGWLQVGGYLWLDRIQSPSGGSAYGGILHVPRVRIDQESTGRLQLRDGSKLVAAWRTAHGRMFVVSEGGEPLRQPGTHCGRCRLTDCPVRAD